MAFGLKLNKDKKVTRINDEGETVEVDIYKMMSHLYSDEIEEIEGWTFRDIMEYIEPLGDVFGHLSWCNFKIFYKEMKKPANPDNFISNIEYIRIGWSVELWEDDDYLMEGLDVVGINDSFTDEEINESEENDKKEEKHRRYALDFTPVNEIADLEIKLDETYQVIQKFDFDHPVFKAKKKFTFLDIVYALLWEISFHGEPEDKEKRMKELSDMAKGIEDGTVKTIPWEEVKESLEKKIKDKE